MKVGELFLALGLAVKDEQFNAAETVIKRLEADLKRVSLNALKARTNVQKAMTTIGLAPPAVAAKRTLKDLVGSGGAVTSTFRRMAAAAVGFFAVSKAKGLVTDVVDLGGKLKDTAQKTGLSAEALQEFGYAAAQNSSSLEEFGDAATKLSKGLVEASKTGKGPVAEAFSSLGISMTDPAVKSKNLEQIMYLVASQFERMPDGANKTAAALKLFGKSGANLIPTLNLGVRGLAELRKKAQDTGNVMSGQTVNALDDFGDQLDEAKGQLIGLRNQGIAAILPVLKDLLTRFQGWIETNREMIRTTIADTVYALAEALRLLGTVLTFVIKHWKAFAVVLSAVAIVNTLMGIAKAVVFFQTVLSAASLAAAASWAAILGPIFLIAAALVGLGIVVYKFRDKIKAALLAVGRFFVNVWRSIKVGVRTAVDSFKQFGSDIISWFESVGQAIVDAFKAAFDWVANKARETVGAIRNAPVIKQVVDFVAGDEPTGPAFDFAGTVAASAASARSQAALDSALGSRFATPSRTIPESKGAAINNQSSYAITVNAANADAKDVAKLVTDKIREHDENQRRRMAANLGLR